MNSLTKFFLLSLCVLAGVLFVVSCRGKPVSESEARQIAEERFLKVCANFKLDRKSYGDPIVTKVAGFPYEFEWNNKPDSNSDGVLITVDDSGLTNVSFVPKTNAKKAKPEGRTEP